MMRKQSVKIKTQSLQPPSDCPNTQFWRQTPAVYYRPAGPAPRGSHLGRLLRAHRVHLQEPALQAR